MSSNYYSFSAIQGRQGEHSYYLIQCPLRLVPRLFLFDEAEVPAKLRQLHSLNATRVVELAHYLTSHPTSYILAPLVAVVDGKINFEPLPGISSEIGQLRISLTARLIIHDGQHRRAAIKQVLTENPAFGDDIIPVMLLPDPQLIHSPRLYTDLNQSSSQRTQSQRVLYDQDSPLASLVRQLVDEVPLFRGLTELEKTTISNRSTALFTLSAIYQATQALLEIGRRDSVSQEQANLARRFWQEVGEIIPEWRQVIRGELKTVYLRQNYVHAHGVTLLAIGHVGHALITAYPQDWPMYLSQLSQINWSRENTNLWEGRAMIRGRMSKARDSVQLTTNALKKALHLPLTDKEQELEQQLQGL